MEMEREMLRELEWRLHGPTPHDFVRSFLALLPQSVYARASIMTDLESVSETQAEIAVLDYSLALQPPSTIALAAILTSTENKGPEAFHPRDRIAFLQSVLATSGINADDFAIRLARRRLTNFARTLVIRMRSALRPRSTSPMISARNYNEEDDLAISPLSCSPLSLSPLDGNEEDIFPSFQRLETLRCPTDRLMSLDERDGDFEQRSRGGQKEEEDYS